MSIIIGKLSIISAEEKNANDWVKVYFQAIKQCSWMYKFLLQQKITEEDVLLSFLDDLKNKMKNELFLIAYIDNQPIGILRSDDYWVPKNYKILSHFPLIVPKFQRKGIGKALLKHAIQYAINNGYQDIWSECWALHESEIKIYEGFYKSLGFVSKSSRLEMSCNVNERIKKEQKAIKGLTIKKTKEISEDMINAISQSYAKSLDKLHSLEKLDNPSVTKEFLKYTKNAFEMYGYKIDFYIAKQNNQLCAGLMTAESNRKGMILEIGVIPEYRNQHIAMKLILDYLNKMTIKGVKEVVLGVDEENSPAVRLYEQLGFKKTWLGNMMRLEDKEKPLIKQT